MAAGDPQMERFSATIRGVATHLDPASTTQWQIADALIRAHPNYGPLGRLLPLGDRPGEALPLDRWLDRIAGLFDLDAVGRSRSQVIDGRLTLLALARLDPDLDALLRSSRTRWRLERDLGFPLEDVFRPWALPARPTEVVELWTRAGVVRPGEPVPMRGCAISPDARLVATSVSGVVKIWDALTGEPRSAVPIARGLGGGVVFSPDGSRLSLSGRDAVSLLDVELGTVVLVLRGEGAIGVCAFSPDGRIVSTVSASHQASLWDATTGAEIATLSDKVGPVPVSDVAFSPDGRRSRPRACKGRSGCGTWPPASGPADGRGRPGSSMSSSAPTAHGSRRSLRTGSRGSQASPSRTRRLSSRGTAAR